MGRSTFMLLLLAFNSIKSKDLTVRFTALSEIGNPLSCPTPEPKNDSKWNGNGRWSRNKERKGCTFHYMLVFFFLYTSNRTLLSQYFITSFFFFLPVVTHTKSTTTWKTLSCRDHVCHSALSLKCYSAEVSFQSDVIVLFLSDVTVPLVQILECHCTKPLHCCSGFSAIHKLSQNAEKPGVIVAWVQFPGASRDFSPSVNFQRRLSNKSVNTAPARHRMHQQLCVGYKSQTLAAAPWSGHTKLLHTLVRMGSAAFVASVALPRSGNPNFQKGLMRN